MRMIRAVFFDFDGTLLDGTGQRTAIRATCEELATVYPQLDAGGLLEANGEVWVRYWPTVADDWTLGRSDGVSVSTEAWRQTLASCGCDDPAALRIAREAHARYLRESLRAYSDALAVLPSLHRDYSLVLVSNGASDTQRTSLQLLGIEVHFDAIAISGEVGVAKPDPAIFHAAMQELGVRPDEVWHVGDDLATDVAGAHAAGATAIWLNRSGRVRSGQSPKPDHELSSLAQLPALLSDS